MRRVYRYRLYPARRQREALDAQLRAACELDDAARKQRRDAHRRCGESVNCGDQQAELTAIRRAGRTLTDAEADEVAAVLRASRG